MLQKNIWFDSNSDAGGKEAKTQWILRLSAIKNKLSKESYSVPVDEYSYVKSVYDWIMEMLTL